MKRRTETPEARDARTAKARKTQMTNAAIRAVDDPARLAKSLRIVRAALASGALVEADLEGDIVQPADLVKKARA